YGGARALLRQTADQVVASENPFRSTQVVDHRELALLAAQQQLDCLIEGSVHRNGSEIRHHHLTHLEALAGQPGLYGGRLRVGTEEHEERYQDQQGLRLGDAVESAEHRKRLT